MAPQYVPGRCNIGRRGRAIRLTTGLVLIALSIILGITVLAPVNRLFSLVLILPLYIGILACLEGSMSFCVLHAARGTYDLNEPRGFATKKSETLQKIGSEDWKKLDRRKALRMHLEALTGAILLALLLTLA
ncbi:hypothetical protein AUF78_11780 [archaeon 13_1_20CM_2_51_12]|nr:MAG: hypothetical protein AUF78_11780 [archaeon 13_1_20CM_2_51_12]